MAPVRRLALALVTPLVATLTIAAPAVAQTTYTWSNNAGNAWLNTGNWTPTGFPGSTSTLPANTDAAVFDNTASPSGGTVGIDMSSGGNQLLQLGAIFFSNTGNDLVVSNSSATAGTLQLNASQVGAQADTVLSNTSGSRTLTIQNGSANTTLSLGLTNGTAYIVGSPGATINIATVISETGGAKSLTLQGGGTTIFSGANTYTGATLVTGNTTLHVTNTTGSATGPGMVAVASPAKLSGTGTIAPSLGSDVQVGGRLQPGSDTAAGTLTVNSNTSIAGASSVYLWSLSNSGTGFTSAPTNGASDAAGQSRLAVTGDLNFQPGTIDIIGLAGLSFDNTKHYSWTVATATGTIAPISAQPTFTTSGLNTGGGTFTLSTGVGGVFVGFTPIPEPASVLVCCAAAAGLTVYVRRKRARSPLDMSTSAI